MCTKGWEILWKIKEKFLTAEPQAKVKSRLSSSCACASVENSYSNNFDHAMQEYMNSNFIARVILQTSHKSGACTWNKIRIFSSHFKEVLNISCHSNFVHFTPYLSFWWSQLPPDWFMYESEIFCRDWGGTRAVVVVGAAVTWDHPSNS